MNLRTISQVLRDLPANPRLDTLLAETLQFNFLEKKQRKVKSMKVVVKNRLYLKVATNLTPDVTDTALFCAETSSEAQFFLVDVAAEVLSKSTLPISGSLMSLFHQGHFFVVFWEANVRFGEENQPFAEMPFPTPIEEILDGQADGSTLVFLLVDIEDRLTRLSISSQGNLDPQQTEIRRPFAVKSAKILGKRTVVLGYGNELGVIGDNGECQSIQVGLPGRILNDFCVQKETGNLVFIADHSFIIVVDGEGRILSQKKVEGIYTRIRGFGGHVLLDDGFPDGLQLLVRIGPGSRPALSEIMVTNRHVLSVSDSKRAIVADRINCEVQEIEWSDKSVCVAHPFLRFGDDFPVDSREPNRISDFLVWRAHDSEDLFRLFVQFDSSKCALLNFNMSGMCQLEGRFGLHFMGKGETPKTYLSHFVARDKECLLVHWREPNGFEVGVLHPASSQFTPLFHGECPPLKAVFAPKLNRLFVACGSILYSFLSTASGFEGMTSLTFQAPLTAIDFQDDVLLAASDASGIHFYRFFQKDDKLDFAYLAGDFKKRKVKYGVFFDEKRAHYVLENGASAFVSLAPESSFTRSPSGWVTERQSPSAVSEEILFPSLKVHQEGRGLHFKPMREAEFELMREGRPGLGTECVAGSGLLFDSFGNVELITRMSSDSLKRILEIPKTPAGQTAFKGLMQQLFAIYDGLACFKGEEVVSLDQLQAASPGFDLERTLAGMRVVK